MVKFKARNGKMSINNMYMVNYNSESVEPVKQELPSAGNLGGRSIVEGQSHLTLDKNEQFRSSLAAYSFIQSFDADKMDLGELLDLFKRGAIVFSTCCPRKLGEIWFTALKTGNIEMISAFLKAGAVSSENCLKSLFYAFENGHLNILEVLLLDIPKEIIDKACDDPRAYLWPLNKI